MNKPVTLYNGNFLLGCAIEDSSSVNINEAIFNLKFSSILQITITTDATYMRNDYNQNSVHYYIFNIPLRENAVYIKIQTKENESDENWVDSNYNKTELLKYFSDDYTTYDYSVEANIIYNNNHLWTSNSTVVFGNYFYNFGGYYSSAGEGRFGLKTFNFNSNVYSKYKKFINFNIDSFYSEYNSEYNFNYHSDIGYNSTKSLCLCYKIINKGTKENIYYVNDNFYLGSETNFIPASVGHRLSDQIQAEGNLYSNSYIFNMIDSDSSAYTTALQAHDNALVQDFGFDVSFIENTNASIFEYFSDPQKIIFCIKVYNCDGLTTMQYINPEHLDEYKNMAEPEILEEIIFEPIDIVTQKIEVQRANCLRYKEKQVGNEIIDVFSSNFHDNHRLDLIYQNNLNDLEPSNSANIYLMGGHRLSTEELSDFLDWFKKEQPDFFDEWRSDDNLISTEILESNTETLTWSNYTTQRDIQLTLNKYKKIYQYNLSDIDIKKLNNFGVLDLHDLYFYSIPGYSPYYYSQEYYDLISNNSDFRLDFYLPEFDYIEITEVYTEQPKYLDNAPYYVAVGPEDIWTYDSSGATYTFKFIKNEEDITENIDYYIHCEKNNLSIFPSNYYSISREISTDNLVQLNSIKYGTKLNHINYVTRPGMPSPNTSAKWHLTSIPDCLIKNDNLEAAWLLVIEDTCMDKMLYNSNLSDYNITEYINVLYNINQNTTYFNIENNGIGIGRSIQTEAFEKKFIIDSNYNTYFQGKTDIFPIGSIYLTLSPANPSQYFIGKWVRFAKGRTLVGVDDRYIWNPEYDSNNPSAAPELIEGPYYNPGTLGGEETHTLTIDEMPSHTHNRRTDAGDRGGADGDTTGSQGYKWHAANNTETTATGGGEPHNNMPPYITCYMWLRIS